MITSNYQVDGDIYSYADKFFCDSHDDKPSNADARDGLINGAILEETDTGKTYIFDKKANQWTEKAAGGGGGGGGSPTLAGLTDVNISNPSNGQTLVYNSTSGKWENGAGDGGGSGILLVEDNNGTLNKTAAEIAAADYAVLKKVPTDESQNPGEWEYVYAPLNAIFTSDGYYFSFFWTGSNGIQYLYEAAAGTDYPQEEGSQP